MTSIDTAPIYGQGESERIVGEAIRGIPRDQVQILTKFGMRWDLPQGEFAFKSKDNQDNPIDIYKYAGKESVIKECEDSLRRLGTDYIDLYQIRLIEQGKVRYAGVCNYDAALLEDAAKLIDLVSDQIPYSMVNRGMDRDIIPYCIRNEKSVIAYSPLERGLLTGKMQPGYRFAEGDHRKENPFFTDESIKRTNAFLEKLQPLADEKKATLGQLVIRWTIEHPGITVALVGARNPEQAIQNAKAADIILTPEELQFINQQIDQMLK